MSCERCGGEMEKYAFMDAHAAICIDCGYIGVPVKHAKDMPSRETWDEAITRFKTQEKAQTETNQEDTEPVPAIVPIEERS